MDHVLYRNIQLKNKYSKIRLNFCLGIDMTLKDLLHCLVLKQ